MATFQTFDPPSFEAWLAKQNIARTVLYIQQHHTWSPSYKHFNGSNHLELQKGMQNFHKNVNGWQDIGQHLTIFPDGKIVTGRSMEVSPACIFGANANAVCIENVGNFDTGGDDMTAEQKESIVRVTAALCKRFNIPVNTDRIVYHHWFDLSTGKRTDGAGITKTCPGTNFFGGNSVEAARANLIAEVSNRLKPKAENTEPEKFKPTPIRYGVVVSDSTAVRNNPSKNGVKMNTVFVGAIMRIYEERNGWLRVSASRQEWVDGASVEHISEPDSLSAPYFDSGLSVWDEPFFYKDSLPK